MIFNDYIDENKIIDSCILQLILSGRDVRDRFIDNSVSEGMTRSP